MAKKQGPKAQLTIYTVLIIVGFVLEIGSTVINVPSQTVKNILLICGIILILLGMILARKDNPYSDKKESLIADDLGFDFSGHFEEYRNVMSRKSGSIKYSSWRATLLKRYNRFDSEPNGKKKTISEDIRFYLKENRRKAEEKVEIVKTLLIPAEFGIVASVYELDFVHMTSEMKFAAVMILSAFICLLCSVEIKTGNKIVKFVDDFCEILHVPMNEDIH